METRHRLPKACVLEILVIVLIVVALTAIIYPVFHRTREQQRQRLCLNQVHQLVTALQQYYQDNKGRYPAHPWTSGILPYLHDTGNIFHCPGDPANQQSMCSYAYNGALMRLDRTGINEAQINDPIDVGVICDAATSYPLGTAGYIPGAGLLPDNEHNTVPQARHNHGIVAGFADGHAAWIPGDFDPADCGSPVTRGFYQSIAINLVNNPAGALPASAAMPDAPFKFPMPSPTHPNDEFDIGGEYCTSPLITALAELWNEKGRTVNGNLDYENSPGFLGEYYTSRSYCLASSFLWGSAQVGNTLQCGAPANAPGDGVNQYRVPAVAKSNTILLQGPFWNHWPAIKPENETGTAIAHDAVVCIVSKNSLIIANPVGGLTTVRNNTIHDTIDGYRSNGWCVCNTATIAAWFTTNGGYSANQWQAYTYSTMTSTLFTFYHYLKIPIPRREAYGVPQAILCTNDSDMVDKVANDPYGIGYCSSAFVDLDRVQVVGMVDATCEGGQCYWPNADANHRTCLPNPYPHGGPNAGLTSGHYRWPAALMRTLFVYTRGDGSLLSLYADKLKRGPLFACSYW